MTDVVKCECCEELFERAAYNQHWNDMYNGLSQRRIELHSLLLAHESAVIALYDIQRADADADDFLGIDIEQSVTKRQVAVARVRETILNKLKG